MVEAEDAAWVAVDMRSMAVVDTATGVALADMATEVVLVHEATAGDTTVGDSAEAMAMDDMAIAVQESRWVITARPIITGPPIIGPSAIPRGVLATTPHILTSTAAPALQSALEWDGAWWWVQDGAASDGGKPDSLAALE